MFLIIFLRNRRNGELSCTCWIVHSPFVLYISVTYIFIYHLYTYTRLAGDLALGWWSLVVCGPVSGRGNYVERPKRYILWNYRVFIYFVQIMFWKDKIKLIYLQHSLCFPSDGSGARRSSFLNSEERPFNVPHTSILASTNHPGHCGVGPSTSLTIPL